MADIDLKRAHGLGLAAARVAAEKLGADLGKKFGLSGDWEGNTLHFERPGVKGALTVHDKDVHLTVGLGFLLKAMRPSIERAVVAEMDQLFAKLPGAAKAASKAAPKAAKSKTASKHPKKGGA